MKRFIALALCLVLIFALVGCGKEKRKIIKLTLSTEDSEAILAAAGIMLPDVEEAKGARSTVVWHAWYDEFHNYSKDEIVNTGFFTFTEKYGGEVDWIECDYFERMTSLANLILSGNPPDFTPFGTNSTACFPMSCIKGQYQPVDPFIDYNDPLWAGMKETADYFVLGGNHYAMVFDLGVSNVIPYNKRILDDWGFDEPAELFFNDEWTWDVFYDMCVEFSDIDEERFALDGYAYAGAILESTGQQILQMDENGIYYSNLDSPEVERAFNLVYDLAKNDCCYHKGGNMWPRNNAIFGSGVKEGLTLFYTIGISFFTDTVENVSALWGDITAGELMFAPLPRDPNGDGIYYEGCSISAYGIVKGCSNPDGAALLASCNRFKIIDPTVVRIDRKQLEEIYMWNEEMLNMWDVCRELGLAHQRIDLTGDLPSALQSVAGDLSSGNAIIRTSNPSTWAQLKEKNRESLEYYIGELNDLIKEMDE